MKLLQSLLEAVSARDVSAYYSQVKASFKSDPKFKAGKTSRAAIASAIHDIAENDPDSGVNAGALVAGVYAKYVAQYKQAAVPAAKPVAEGFDSPENQAPTAPPSNLSSKDRSFDPSPEGMDDDIGGADDADGVDPEVQELKDLRTADISDTLTPEQKSELETLRSQKGDMDCDTGDCMDDHPMGDKPKAVGTSMPPMKESCDMSPKAKAALKKRATKGTEEEEAKVAVPAKKTVGRDLDESAKAERAEKLASFGKSMLGSVLKKPGSFLG